MFVISRTADRIEPKPCAVNSRHKHCLHPKWGPATVSRSCTRANRKQFLSRNRLTRRGRPFETKTNLRAEAVTYRDVTRVPLSADGVCSGRAFIVERQGASNHQIAFTAKLTIGGRPNERNTAIRFEEARVMQSHGGRLSADGARLDWFDMVPAQRGREVRQKPNLTS